MGVKLLGMTGPQSMTAWAIASYGLTRVFARVFVGNDGSARVLERSGFMREATMGRSASKDGRVRDQWMYSFVAEEPDGDPGR